MTDITSRLSPALADRYEIRRRLGEGGMAIVYLAEDMKHRRKLALKVLKPELAVVLGAERFLREITITANLRHPHILPLYDSGEVGELLFYVMPFVEGESLRERLEREKQLPVADAIAIASEVGDALAYAHARGVIHRDVKPENLLLEGGHAVVADFGIARAVSAAGGERLTQTGMAVGTPSYMSPEQAGGSTELDGRSDLYALACVLYEMLGGQPPFTGPTVESVVHQHITVVPPPITNLRPAVPPQVADALQRALAKNPADRFNPVTQFVEALKPGATVAPIPAASRSSTRKGRAVLLASAVAVLVLAAVALVLDPGALFQTGPGGRSLTALAVLPLENRSNEPGQEYFVDGMTDALITELSKIEALRVISRTSVMQYRGANKPLRDIARELNVDGLVEGSVLRDGSRVRISAQLIDAGSDRNLWADSYDRSLDDILALHSDVARAIAEEVRVVLTEADEKRLTVSQTVDREAHDLLLRGRYHWRRGSAEESVALLEAATAEDPEYAAAWAELGRAYARLSRDDPGLLSRARTAVQRALEINPDLAEVQTALGQIAFYHDWDWDTARRALERAIELNPGYDDAHQIYGDYFEVFGQWERAIAQGLRSKEVNPVNAEMRMNLGLTYSYAGRFDEAIGECRGALQLDALASWTYFCLADAHLRNGDTSEALVAAETAVRLEPADVHRAMLARVLTFSDQRDRADSIVASLESESEHRYVSPWFLAWVHTGLGNTERALDLLERAVQEHATYTPWVNGLSDFDGLRSNPRFMAVLRRLKLAGGV